MLNRMNVSSVRDKMRVHFPAREISSLAKVLEFEITSMISKLKYVSSSIDYKSNEIYIDVLTNFDIWYSDKSCG